jgi:lipopolysaccharide/colanic/teichoic acid biosynthesis glycosyltransferase
MLMKHNTDGAENGVPRAQPRSSAPAGGYETYKGMVEFGLALFLLLVATPLVLIAAVLVRLTSRGPAFYLQRRLGYQGRPFTIYKLRTMRHEAELLTGPRWASSNDPRITGLGRILRRFHIDELPQLANVLRGEMSLIGPRPERPEIISALEEVIPCYRDRLQVRPGITGLAQVQLPPDCDVASVRRKLAYDLYYVRQLGLWLDLRILLSTVGKLLGVPFGVFGILLRMPGSEVVERAYEALIAHTNPPQVRPA